MLNSSKYNEIHQKRFQRGNGKNAATMQQIERCTQCNDSSHVLTLSGSALGSGANKVMALGGTVAGYPVADSPTGAGSGNDMDDISSQFGGAFMIFFIWCWILTGLLVLFL
jgi:hypothetical protein